METSYDYWMHGRQRQCKVWFILEFASCEFSIVSFVLVKVSLSLFARFAYDYQVYTSSLHKKLGILESVP